MSRTLCDIKLYIPINNSGKGGFDYTLKVANVFDNVVTNNKISTFAMEQLDHTYHNQVLHYADFQTYWPHAIKETAYIKNDDGTYKSDAFLKIQNTFFNYVASARHPVAAGNCLLHYMCSGKKKPMNMTPNPITPASRKCCILSNSWIAIMKRHLTMKNLRSSFLFFPQETHQ